MRSLSYPLRLALHAGGQVANSLPPAKPLCTRVWSHSLRRFDRQPHARNVHRERESFDRPPLPPALVDEHGDVVRGTPCQRAPGDFDADATIATREHAAHQCRTKCAAIVACGRLRLALGAEAEGVLAGVVLNRKGSGSRRSRIRAR